MHKLVMAECPWVGKKKNIVYQTPFMLPAVDVNELLKEDEINEENKVGPWRFGFNHQVNLGLKNDGKWMELENGDRIWKMIITCPGALSVNVIFDQFSLPIGGKVFLYDLFKSNYLGAFTHKNNKKNGILAVAPIKGSSMVIEYFEPAGVEGEGKLNIGTVTHGYKDLFGYAKDMGESGICNVNVNCSSGNNWRDQIRSVALITVGGNEICSGALINNTKIDGTPYFLTANHCTEGENVANWVFLV